MKLELDEQDLMELNAALIERPFKNVAPLINKINAQIREQQAKTDSAAENGE